MNKIFAFLGVIVFFGAAYYFMSLRGGVPVPQKDGGLRIDEVQSAAQEQASSVETAKPKQNNQGNENTMDVATELKIETTKPGTGDRVTKNGDTIDVHYTGMLTDGTKFDSSVDRGQPFEFQLGAHMVIEGWEEGLLGMKVGEKRTLTIPASMGYGPNGYPPVIPGNATLVFETELIAIK